MELIKRNTGYALRALLSLSRAASDEKKTLNEISSEMKIPKALLRKILQKLGTAKIIKAYSGKNGGYRLIKSLNKITTNEILTLMQGNFTINKCFLSTYNCSFKKTCPIRKNLKDVQTNIINYFDNIFLKDLFGNQKKFEFEN